VHGAPVGVNEILQESKSALERGRAVAERSLYRLPETDVVMIERHHPDAQQMLADRPSIPPVA